MTQLRLDRFLTSAVKALRDCLIEEPDGLLAALAILSVLLVFWVGYELIFDPYATGILRLSISHPATEH